MTVESEASYIFQGKVSKKPLMCVGGDGMYITIEDPVTKEKKVVLDALSGAAVSSAAEKSVYTFGSYFANYAAEELGKFICDRSHGAFTSALFTGSGSEANENALKIMKQYHIENGEPQRYKFISRHQSYHGYTIGALSIGEGPRKVPFRDILLSDDQTPKVSQCYPYRNKLEGESDEDYGKRLVQELEDVFIREGTDKVAGVIMETVGGSTFGTSPPVPGYLDGVKAVCEKYGALFMLDEVMCGMGRCGSYMTWDQFMTNGGPDIQSVGKTIGSGFVTLAGLLISPKIKNVYDAGSGFIAGAQTYHSHQFNCLVGLAVQKKIMRDNLVENIKETGTYMAEQLKIALKDSKIAGDVRGCGSFWSVELVKDKATKEPFDPKLDVCHLVQDQAYENGITLMGGSGTIDGKIGDHVTVGPSYIMTKAEADIIVKALSGAILSVEKKLFA
ncbi:transferase activity protein [[Candida] boidinii]|nr:transferase activity protein [[Candida] boidinii]